MLKVFLFLVSFGFLNSNNTFAEESGLSKLLAQHKNWNSFVISRLTPDGPLSNLTGFPQSWEFTSDTEGNGLLVEKLETTVRGDCHKFNSLLTDPLKSYSGFRKIFKWERGQVSLSNDFDLKSFIQLPAIKCALNDKVLGKMIVTKSGDRIEVTWKNEKLHILVFYPSPFEDQGSSSILNKRSNLWAAPLGPEEEMFSIFLAPMNSTGYLRNDLSRKKKVVLNKDFPTKYIPNVEEVLREWNTEFEVPFYVLEKNKKDVETIDCLTSHVLCLEWKGPEDIAWTGFAAQAISSYNPENGIIFGSIIKMELGRDKLKKPIDSYENWFSAERSFEDYARVFMKQEIFAKYQRPDSESLFSRTLTHEIGHANGFGHNFAGSILSTENDRQQATIMEYWPFPYYGSWSVNLGYFDKDLIDIQYNNRKTLPERFIYCSDFETHEILNLTSVGLYKLKPECQVNDMGLPHEWLVKLASYGSDGVFSQLPLDFLKRNILHKLVSFLKEENNAAYATQVNFVKQYLCSRPDKTI